MNLFSAQNECEKFLNIYISIPNVCVSHGEQKEEAGTILTFSCVLL